METAPLSQAIHAWSFRCAKTPKLIHNSREANCGLALASEKINRYNKFACRDVLDISHALN
ncbi:MAG TPA: hypothetical protein DEQ14_03980 [Treponema sp.]|nr:hypothetical protein [Treponema sp.]